MNDELAQKAISANIEALRQILANALVRTSDALQAIERGQQNQAVGALVPLDAMLETADRLFRAAMALHRVRREP